MLPSLVKVALNAKLTFLDLHLLDFGLLIPPFWCSAGKYFCQYFLQIFLVVFRRKITNLPSLLLEAEVLYIGSGQRIFEDWRDTSREIHQKVLYSLYSNYVSIFFKFLKSKKNVVYRII